MGKLKSPEEMGAAVSASMKERTGRTVEEWVTLVGATDLDPLDQRSVRRWLQAEHGVLMNSQWAIADAAARAAGWVRPSLEEYVDSQFSGAKAGLRPIFDRLRDILEALGDDVSAEGRASYTPFVRARQFAAVAAATRARVDLGLRFTDAPGSPRLLSTGLPGQSTHRVALASPDEIDDEVIRLIREAYAQNG